MGHTFIERSTNGVDVSAEVTLVDHLTSSYSPPVTPDMLTVCREAIDAASRGNWNKEIDLRGVATYRNGITAPVHAVIESYHLESFIDVGQW